MRPTLYEVKVIDGDFKGEIGYVVKVDYLAAKEGMIYPQIAIFNKSMDFWVYWKDIEVIREVDLTI